MRNRRWATIFAICCATLLAACGGGADVSSDESDLSGARRNRCHADADCHNGQVCHGGKCVAPSPPDGGSTDGGGGGGCQANADCGSGRSCVSGACYLQQPQPSSCAANGHGNPGLQAVVQITSYKGLDNNKLHELASGTIVGDIWSTSGTPINGGVDLAMRIGSGGLPGELPLAVGERIELEGFYIDPASNYSHDGNGVIHWTHSPCGYVNIRGVVYQ